MNKKRVLGNNGKIFRIVFLMLITVITILFGILIIVFPSKWFNFMINMICYDLVFLCFIIIIPRYVFLENYKYQVDENGLYIYNKDRKIIFLNWDDVEVSLCSVVVKGNVKSPVSAVPSIIICPKELMLDPMIFPFGSFKGQGGRAAIIFSKENLSEISKFYKRKIRGNIDFRSCMLSFQKVNSMQASLEEINSHINK